MYTGIFQFFCAVSGAEVRIYNIQVCDTDRLAFLCQLQGIVYGNIPT